MIKYLGSKRLLLEKIYNVSKVLPNAKNILDIFSGTSRVGHYFKQKGFQVFSNDYSSYGYTIATCYVEADLEKVEKQAIKLIKEFSSLKDVDGYFTDTFCKKSRFFQEKNGRKIDAIREAIEKKDLDPILKSVLLVSLMEAADRIDSTTGVQMAYLKQYAKRSFNDLELRMPDVLPSVGRKCKAFNLDALEAADKIKADIIYLDPPYNQHSYLGNYHIWETLVKWDKPEFYGVACKRIDTRENKSKYNSKVRIIPTFKELIKRLQCKLAIVSFNDEGFISKEKMIEILSSRGKVSTIENEYKRYVGAKIGIHNQKGEKVGKVKKVNNKEFIFVLELTKN